MIHLYHFWIYTQENQSLLTIEIASHQRLLQHYSAYPSYGISLGTQQQMNGLRKCGIYTHWSIIQS
jgi:hypothetical protein